MTNKLAVMGFIAVALIGGFTAVSILLNQLGVSLYRVAMTPPQTITVTGTAKNDATNQVAQFNANVSQTGDSKEAVNQALQETVESLVASAKEFGIEEKNIKTQFFNIYQEEMTNYESEDLTVRKGPWRGNTNVSFSQIPANQAQSFADILVSSGATSIDGPSYSLEDFTSSQDELAEEAINQARQKASRLAASQGLTLGKVLSIDETNSTGGVFPLFNARMEGGGGGADSFMPGSSEVSKTVTVTFELR